LARLTQIDYDREMAFVCERPDAGKDDGLLGVVRLAADPDRMQAEYAIALRFDAKGIGLGRRLMVRILDYAKSRQIGEIYGEILRENHKMVELCNSLGFTVKSVPDQLDMVHASLKLADWGERAEAAAQ
jgi:acetyltransferase